MVGEIGPGWSLAVGTPHIIQILSISEMHIASAIDASIDVCPFFCVSVVPNLLFDRTNSRLSAVLDFDFAHIGAPVSEYLFSFWDLDGLLSGSSDPIDPLRNYILEGFPFRGSYR